MSPVAKQPTSPVKQPVSPIKAPTSPLKHPVSPSKSPASPKKKRVKTVAAAATEVNASSPAAATPTTPTTPPVTSEEVSHFPQSLLPSLQELDEFFTRFLERIESKKAADRVDSSLFESLLILKAWQDHLLSELDSSQAELDQAFKRKERQERALAALHFEKDHLDRELDSCRNFELVHLKQLAREELGATITSEPNNQTEIDETTLLANFLQANVHDPNDKHKIVGRLHQELADRGRLERDLKAAEKQLAKLRKELQAENSFLQSLPDHLAAMERASLPLQKFMSSQGMITIGTERQQRLKMAKTLPAPLYTLFQQMQHYLDETSASTSSGMQLSVTGVENDGPQSVVLQVPIPERANKRVSIHFHYHPVHNVVTAVATGAAGNLNQDYLLEELFPGDVADKLPDSTVGGRPYHWCNYLAGLHFAPQHQQAIDVNSSLRVVMHELERRVRANANLKKFLHALQRLNVPGLERLKTNCQLLKFADDTNNKPDASPNKKLFLVHIHNKETNEDWYLHCNIHMARYPIIPPVWNFTASSSKDQPDAHITPLYDARLAALEKYVNVTGLMELVGVSKKTLDKQDSDATIANDEKSYELILLRQMRYLMEHLSNRDDDNNETASSRK